MPHLEQTAKLNFSRRCDQIHRFRFVHPIATIIYYSMSRHTLPHLDQTDIQPQDLHLVLTDCCQWGESDYVCGKGWGRSVDNRTNQKSG